MTALGSFSPMATKVSPLAPARFPDMPPVEGVRLATAAAGIRYAGRTDVLLTVLAPGTAAAGVLTRSKCPSAPVDWCRARLKGGKARALVVNSGNANAFTGRNGREAAKFTADIAAKALGCKPGDVFLASTGVIGEPLKAAAFDGVMDGLVADATAGRWQAAAEAIMTTDTFPKGATATARLGKATVTICGIAKGAGMIAPDMATMLSFVFTDAPIAAPALQSLLARGSDPRLAGFRAALDRVLKDLAEQVARDGEGARKLVEVVVEGAISKSSARRIAMSIANSPLVKTAIAGED